MSEVYKNEVDVQIILTVYDTEDIVANISQYTTKTLLLKKPLGTVLEKTMDFVTDGTDGKIYYTVETGVFDESGVWEIQALLTNGTSLRYTAPETLIVGDVLQ